jgi:hypothetical protein
MISNFFGRTNRSCLPSHAKPIRVELILANRDVLLVIVYDAAVRRTRRALASVEPYAFDLLQIVERRFRIVFRPKETVDQIDILGRVR